MAAMDSVKKINQNFIVGVVLALAFLMSLLALWVTIHGQTNVSNKLENFQQTITGIKPINAKDVTVEQIAEAVSKYCAQNKCIGLDGRDGQSIQGPIGPQGVMGLPGISIVGPQGSVGEKGTQGEQGISGTDGRTLEQRCTVVDNNTRRIEQKYTDVETWEVLYYLAPRQRCPEEVE